jgi:hypothetical protein
MVPPHLNLNMQKTPEQVTDADPSLQQNFLTVVFMFWRKKESRAKIPARLKIDPYVTPGPSSA